MWPDRVSNPDVCVCKGEGGLWLFSQARYRLSHAARLKQSKISYLQLNSSKEVKPHVNYIHWRNVNIPKLNRS